MCGRTSFYDRLPRSLNPPLQNAEIFRRFFGHSTNTPELILPIDKELLKIGARRPTWLSLIFFFFSKRFLIPSLKLMLFPVASILHESFGAGYMYFALVAAFTLELVVA